MKRPISKGDLCIIVNGVYKQKSPNIGKIVTVQQLKGEHSTLGQIWACSGQDLLAFDSDTGPSGTVDIPAVWLQRIEPPAPPEKAKAKDLELSE